MKALIKAETGIALVDRPLPPLASDTDVRVRIGAAGICRTDLYAADGRLPVPPNLILGHEAAGTVVARGTSVTRVRVGDRVAINPILACGQCRGCRSEDEACLDTRQLGVHLPGVFAEYVTVPQSALFPLKPETSMIAGAYAEPVAAASAVLELGLPRSTRGMMAGRGRIARLTLTLLRAEGYEGFELGVSETDSPSLEGCYDVVIESEAARTGLTPLLKALRVGGTLILKSRPVGAVPLDLALAVRKHLILRAIAYGDFGAAVQRLETPGLGLEMLAGGTYPLTGYEAAFRAAVTSEDTKQFFVFPDEMAD